jgi:hypothetical protein
MDRIRNRFRSFTTQRSEANPSDSSGAGPSNTTGGAARSHTTAGSDMFAGLSNRGSNRPDASATAPSSSRPRAAIRSGQAAAPAQDPILALLPSIAAGVPIDEMQAGQSAWLRSVFYENGHLATGGREYIESLGHDDQIRLRDALRERRHLYRQQGTQSTEPMQSLAQTNENIFAAIAPVLDRFALNESMANLEREVPIIRQCLLSTTLARKNGEAWLRSLSEDHQTRVLEALADRNAIRQIGPHLVAASAMLANPAIDVSAAAAAIGRSAQDLLRLAHDAGLTERGAQYLSRLPAEQQAAVQYNFQVRNSQRGVIPSPDYSLSVPVTPSSASNLDLNLDAWRAQLVGDLPHESSVSGPGSSFVMPSSPSYGWALDHGAGEGSSHWQEDAASAPLAHSPQFSWPVSPMGEPPHGYGSPASIPPSESSFAMPATPSGGWMFDLNAGEGSSHWHDNTDSVPPADSPAFSLSIPATPSSSSNFRFDLNLDAWQAELIGETDQGSPAPMHEPEPPAAMLRRSSPQRPAAHRGDSSGAGPSSLPTRAAAAPARATAHTEDPILALLPSIAAGVPIDEMQVGLSVRLRNVFAENGSMATRGREYFDRLGYDDKGRFLEALRLRRQAHQQRVAMQPAEPMQSLSQIYENAFLEIAPVLDRFALNEKVTELAQEAPAVRLYLTTAGLNARNGEAWLRSLSDDRETRVREAIADRTAIQNLGRYIVQISSALADPATDLATVASRLGCNLHDLHRLFTDSGLTETGTQYLARVRPERRLRVEQNIQLRNSRRDAMAAPTPEPSFVMPSTPSGGWQWDMHAGEGSSHAQDDAPAMPAALSPAFSLSIPATPSEDAGLALDLGAWHAQLMGAPAAVAPAPLTPHEELATLVDALGAVPMRDLQQRVRVPLAEYFVQGEGITERGFHFFNTLSEQQQMRLQFALRIPHDVLTYYRICSVLDQYEAGVSPAALRPQMRNLSAYLTDEGGLARTAGAAWYQGLSPERQARIARATADRRIINSIGPRFVQISSTFSNPANDMERVARRARVPVQDLNRFLTDDGLTPLGQRFLDTLDRRTRQVIEANLALRRV